MANKNELPKGVSVVEEKGDFRRSDNSIQALLEREYVLTFTFEDDVMAGSKLDTFLNDWVARYSEQELKEFDKYANKYMDVKALSTSYQKQRYPFHNTYNSYRNDKGEIVAEFTIKANLFI